MRLRTLAFKSAVALIAIVVISIFGQRSFAAYLVEGEVYKDKTPRMASAEPGDESGSITNVTKGKPVLMEEDEEDSDVASDAEQQSVKEKVPVKPAIRNISKNNNRKDTTEAKKKQMAPEEKPRTLERQEPIESVEEREAPKAGVGEMLVFPALTGALGKMDSDDPDDPEMQYEFDLEFPVGNGNSLRYYNTHAEETTLRSGVEWKHDRSNGKFRKWEVTNFRKTPQFDDALGIKYSYGSSFKETAFGAVFLPEMNTWSYPTGAIAPNSSQIAIVASLRKNSGPKFLYGRKSLNAYYNVDKTYQAAFIGKTPIGYSLSKANVEPRVALAWTPSYGATVEVAYVNNVQLGELAYNLMAARTGRSGADWARLVTHNGSGEIGASKRFRNANIFYRMNTTSEFRKERESVGASYSRGGYILNAEYSRIFGFNDFYEIPDKEITRASLTKKIRKNYEAGALFESRRGGSFIGFQLFTEGAGGNHLPDTIYRDMKVPSITYDGVNHDAWGLCERISNLNEAVGVLKNEYMVAAYTECLNMISTSKNYFKVAPPKDVIQGAKMNCISSAWLQSYVLSNNGYIAYPVGIQATKLFLGEVESDEVDQMHAIVAYKKPDWEYWELMDYNEIIGTTGKTIEEALRAYDPNYTGFTVFDAQHLTMLGVYNNATFEEIDRWIEDKD